MPPRHPQLARAFALSNAGQNAEAILIVNQLASQGEPEALYTLAEMKWRGGMVAQDPPQGRELYRRAGEAGHAQAAENHTNLLANGVAGPRDWVNALQRLRGEARRNPRRREALALIEKMRLTDNGDPASLPEGQPLSTSPQVTSFPHLLTATECAYLRQVAEPGYGPSTVRDAHRQLVRDPIRTSDGSTIHWLMEDPAIHALNRRFAAITGTSAEQGEALQILRYRPGQQYHRHFDYVPAADNQRDFTVLVYLNHDYKGGETCFVNTGLSVKGRKGDGMMFCNSLPTGEADKMAEHAGLPVTAGAKYLASRWIRARRWAP